MIKIIGDRTLLSYKLTTYEISWLWSQRDFDCPQEKQKEMQHGLCLSFLLYMYRSFLAKKLKVIPLCPLRASVVHPYDESDKKLFDGCVEESKERFQYPSKIGFSNRSYFLDFYKMEVYKDEFFRFYDSNNIHSYYLDTLERWRHETEPSPDTLPEVCETYLQNLASGSILENAKSKACILDTNLYLDRPEWCALYLRLEEPQPNRSQAEEDDITNSDENQGKNLKIEHKQKYDGLSIRQKEIYLKLSIKIRAIYDERDIQCQAWIKQEKPKINEMSVKEIKEAICQYASKNKLNQVWGNGVDDWWKFQEFIVCNPGSKLGKKKIKKNRS